MKKCWYCGYSFEDDQGTWCGVDWDTLEYENPKVQERVNKACEQAEIRKQKAEKEK